MTEVIDAVPDIPLGHGRFFMALSDVSCYPVTLLGFAGVKVVIVAVVSDAVPFVPLGTGCVRLV